MKNFNILLFSVFSIFTFSQTILTQQETASRIVQDPGFVVLGQGFHATSSVSNPFVAKIGPSNGSEPGGGPEDSDAGANNPAGTVETMANKFHDTQGSIDVTGAGQLQFTLPIALPPGIKSVAPQVNLVYTSGSGNGIAGYGWNISGISAISRIGKTIEKDGAVRGIQLDYSDYYSFNGQRLILKSGIYGHDGAEYETEKYSNIKIKSVGSISGQAWQGPEYWEVTFEDGSQAWYGGTTGGPSSGKTPIEYNIVKWKDAQGNSILYNYILENNVSRISTIEWGGNENLGKAHFNKIEFSYLLRSTHESSYLKNILFKQVYLLNDVKVVVQNSQFKKYKIVYHKKIINSDNSTVSNYERVKEILEYNSNNESANPIKFESPNLNTSTHESSFGDYEQIITTGDFNGDGLVDFFVKQPSQSGKPEGYYIYFDTFNSSGSDFIYLGSSTNYDNKSIIPFIIYPADNFLKPKQGIVVVKNVTAGVPSTNSIELNFYSLKIDNTTINTSANPLLLEYSKTIGAADLLFNDLNYPNSNYPPIYSISSQFSKFIAGSEVDIDSDGVSELILTIQDSKNFEVSQSPTSPCTSVEPDPDTSTACWVNRVLGYRYVVIDKDDLQNNTHHILTFSSVKNIMGPIMDFNNDGVQEILNFEKTFNSENITYYTRDGVTDQVITKTVNTPVNDLKLYTLRKSGSNYFINFSKTYSIKGRTDEVLFGDLNGDKNMEILLPLHEEELNQTYYTGWSLYLNTGDDLIESVQGLMPNSHDYSGASIYYTKSALIDIDNDGKSEIVNSGVHFSGNTGNVKFWTNLYGEAQFDANNLMFNWSFNKKKLFDIEKPKMIADPIFGDYRIGGANPKILFLLKNTANSNRYIFSYNHYSVEENYSKITQGEVNTLVEYKGVYDDGTEFYKPVKKELYPFFEVEENRLQKVVSTIKQGVGSLSSQYVNHKFLYRGLIVNLHGKGIIGFRQHARSSWHPNSQGSNFIPTWSGAEIDPIKEGLPIKEWTIRTSSESSVFPNDISENNTELLSYKSTSYLIDKLYNGQVVTSFTDAQKPKIVTAIGPLSTLTKDFLTNTLITSNITYGDHYLPLQAVQDVNNGFGITTSTFEYFHNATGVGADYFIGRPKSKTDVVQAYGDIKSSKQEFTYENNLLKSSKNWNRDNSGYLLESYGYDGFGNIVQKTISNSLDAQTQTSSTQYDPKGRFVIKKTDHLGLETHITYNNWGQILTQTNPVGNVLTNTYDGWGKLLKSKTNLGGTTTYKYEKLSDNLGIKVSQYSPDGNEIITYTNPLAQNYKTTTKSFGQGTYVSRNVEFDVLGRKKRESEPYFEGQNPNQWNEIEYDDSVFPPKVTVTAFTGKQMETSISGNVTTVTELNGYNRISTKTTDALGNLASATDKGGTITFTYNAAGEQIQAQYEQNIVTTEYDVWGNKSKFNDPSNGEYRYEYDGFGHPKKVTSPKGKKEYTYNALGQLVSQTEVSATNATTNKNISFAYDDKGRMISKTGISNGKPYSSSVVYDPQGRLLSSSESSNEKYYIQKGITYDDKGRVISYEKSLYSSGVITKTTVENLYSAWNGQLYMVREKDSGKKSLWNLQQVNAKGQVLTADLGKTRITNTYDSNGFLVNIFHSDKLTLIGNPATVLEVSYSFDAIRNELTGRTTAGDFNILEAFTYDDNNRLVSWVDPVTSQIFSNTYDNKGRILVNDQVGTIKYENAARLYQPTGMTLNAAGEQNYNNDLIQHILYNENNDPVFIDGIKGDVALQYGLTGMRQRVTYGGNFAEDGDGDFTKFYSEDGSFEILRDNVTGKEKHILYIGGSPYESNIVFLKDFDETAASYRFLHKDYLGSVLAVTDEEGNKLEQRHYDAWGNFTHLKIGNGSVITDKNIINNTALLIDRGYTSHEYFAEVGIIHMNGRLYDPLLRRFLNADEHIQDPYNTQNYNKYGYVLNNPLMYNDPGGEFIQIAALVAVIAKAVIFSGIMYMATAIVTNNGSKQGFIKSITFGAITAAVTYGIGTIFQAGGSIAKAISETWTMIAKIGAHAITQGLLNEFQGGKFWAGFVAGAFSAGANAYLDGKSISTEGLLAIGTVSGGVGSVLAGGNFWMGAMSGFFVTAFNHLEHKMTEPGDDKKVKTAEKLAEEYRVNDNRIMAESVVVELLLESTTPGEFTLKAIREELYKIYGNDNMQRLNDVYTHAVDVYTELNNRLGKNGLTTIAKIKLSTGLIADIMSLHARNSYIEYRVKYLDLNTYFNKIRPDLAPKRGSFGGGGAKGSY